MFIKQLDYLSPTVTFYHKGFLSHSSILSGILSIISMALILAVAIYFSLDIILRKNPTSFYFNRFVDNAGIFPLNSSSFFHFISISNDLGELRDQGVDFKSFRIIGLETFYQFHSTNRSNLINIDHWIYGFCNNKTDTAEISHLIDYDYFEKSACIRKYYNSREKKYYDTWEENFRWPLMAHGTFNPNNKFYCVIIEKCFDETLSLILNESNYCKNEEEIKKILGFNSAVHFFYIDNYIDVLNFNSPNIKYFYRIENTIQSNNYVMNHLNFNPTLVKTHNGLIFDHITEDFSYSFERNDVFTYNDDNKTYSVYYLWLNNRINYYERNYKRVQDVVSSIGGIYQFITFTAIFINNLYNHYIILSDTENLLYSSIHNEKLHYSKSGIKFDYQKELKDLKSKKKSKQNEKDNNKRIFNNKNYKNERLNNEKVKSNSFSKSNEFCLTDKPDIKINKSQQNEKKENEKENDNKYESKSTKKIKSFMDYLIFRLSCNKKHNSFNIYQKFRIRILSEEHLIKNHLYIYNLLRVNERKIHSKRRLSYQLKDLIRLV